MLKAHTHLTCSQTQKPTQQDPLFNGRQHKPVEMWPGHETAMWPQQWRMSDFGIPVPDHKFVDRNWRARGPCLFVPLPGLYQQLSTSDGHLGTALDSCRFHLKRKTANKICIPPHHDASSDGDGNVHGHPQWNEEGKIPERKLTSAPLLAALC